MKALVTGATGFTGDKLARELFQRGFQVRVLARDPGAVVQSQEYQPEIIRGDIREKESVFRAVKSMDLVFHIAALYRSGRTDEKTYWDIHVEGTRHIVEAALHYQVGRVVHCSTVGVHGDVQNGIADEDFYFKPGDIYQLTKLNGELLALRLAGQYGVPIVVIRPTAIFGPGDFRLLKLFKLAKQRVIAFPGTGNIHYHMVYVQDLVDAFILASERETALGESFIIGADDCLTLNELLDLMGSCLGRQGKKIHLPAGPFQVAGSACEALFGALGREPPIYRRRVDFFTKNRHFTIHKAKEILGFRPKVSLASGIQMTADWYVSEGFIGHAAKN